MRLPTFTVVRVLAAPALQRSPCLTPRRGSTVCARLGSAAAEHRFFVVNRVFSSTDVASQISDSAMGVLKDDLGFDLKDLERVAKKFPGLWRYPAADARLVVHVLQHDVGLQHGKRKSALASALRRCPEILFEGDRVGAGLEAIRVAVPDASIVAYAIETCPDALLRDSTEIAAIHLEIAGFGMDFPKMIKRAPRILLRDPSTVRHLFDFLVEPLEGGGMTREQASATIEKFPMLLIGCRNPEEQVKPLIRFFNSLGVHPAHETVAGFYAWPDSADTLVPAAAYLRDECGFTQEELRENVSLLGYSLNARIWPRMEYAKKLAQPRPSIRELTAIDDTQFCYAVGSRLPAYQEFALELRHASKKKWGLRSS